MLIDSSSSAARPLGTHLLRTVFVVSTGRTGTLALSEHLKNTYTNVAAFHEPKPSRRFRLYSNLQLCGRIAEARVVRALHRHRRQRLNALASGTIYIEANPFLHGCIGAIETAFVNPCVIHIVRHPVDYIRSHIKHGAFAGIKGLAGRYFPYWLLKPDHYEPHRDLRWRDLSPEAYLAWRWATLNAVMDTAAEPLGKRYLRVRFEDLYARESDEMRRVTSWLGLGEQDHQPRPMQAARLNQGARSIARGFDVWPEALREQVHELCREQMARYGYDSLDPRRNPGSHRQP